MTPKPLVQAWVEAFNRRDADAIARFYAENAINHQVAEPAPVEGRAAIRAMFAAAASSRSAATRSFSGAATGTN